MKITLSWLKDYLETGASLNEIVECLNMLGLVVDKVVDRGQELADFKIVEIVSADKHPEADRLKVCQVYTGTETLQVVCGGVNARSGMKAVLAPIDSVIPTSGLRIKASKLRGVDSNGMLCSANELGLGENDPVGGILDLATDAPVGVSYADYAGLSDPVIDIEITPNRGDCLGAYGIARDLAAAGLGILRPLEVSAVQGKFDSPINVVIRADTKEVCKFFAGRYIKNVKNGPSPLWMQQRLLAVGLRPISSLVDITNYLTYALGRPMHVFDADVLQGDIVVRLANEGERILALDKGDYQLEKSMTVVADQHNAHAIAGIIGGDRSGCSESTKNVFVEAALFNNISTSLTGRSLNIMSDARYRFERGVDPDMILPAIDIATKFILENCGGEASNIVCAGELPSKRHPIKFSPKRVYEFTSLDIPAEEIESILYKLGFNIDSKQDIWLVAPPSWRNDVSLEADLIEEVTRIFGYDKIPSVFLPPAHGEEKLESSPDSTAHQQWAWSVRRALSARGLDEALTWSFLSQDRALFFGGGSPELKLVNPISSELSDMRPSLLPNLIDAVQRNYDRGQQNIHLFEVGKQFTGIDIDGEAQVVAGVRSGLMELKHWAQTPREIDPFDAKADAIAALQVCGVNTEQLQVITPGPAWYHPGRSAFLSMGPQNALAAFGEIHPKVLLEMDVDQKVIGFEVFLGKIASSKERRSKPIELSPYQPLERDFAFIVDSSMQAAKVIQAAKNADRDLITKVSLFDVYEGKGIEEGRKSLAITVLIEPKKGTLTEDMLQELSSKIISNVKKLTGGELRS